MDWYLKVMKNYVGFTGRARRKEYWMFALFYLLFMIILQIAASILGDRVGAILMSLFGLAHLLPAIAVGIRRLHDTDRSGWWLLIAFVPVIGSIWLIVLFVLEGTAGTNRFGPDPKAAG